MRKILLAMVALSILGGVGYHYKIEILLAAIKFQVKTGSEVAASREVHWQSGPPSADTPANKRPPNIILIVADDLGINDISTFGGGIDGGRMKTPNIDRLAAQGVVFNQSYSGASTCAPSRAMMMTGRYPTRTGYEFTPTPNGMGGIVTSLYNDLGTGLPPAQHYAEREEGQPGYGQKGLPSSEVTIAEVLKEKGYYTAHIGKWHMGDTGGMDPNSQGFDDSLLMSSGLFLPEDHPEVVNAKLDFDPIDRFLWARSDFANSFNSGRKDPFRPKAYLTDYWTDEAVKVIKENKNRPFFLFLAHWGPHTPLQSTKQDYEAVGDIEPHRTRVYAGMVRAVDRSVGRVMQALEEEGLSENTIVVFTRDNGGAGYIGIPEVNQPYRGWKITMFEGGIRVPMLVKWPAKISAGTKIDTPVAHIDVMPTLAAAANTELPKGVEIDGKNILSLLNGDSDWMRETLFWQNGHYQMVRHGDWKLQVNDRPVGGMKKWLFNLKEDPTEQRNLAEKNKDKVEELTALLAKHQATSRGPLYESVAEIPVMIDKTLNQNFEQGDEYIYTPN